MRVFLTDDVAMIASYTFTICIVSNFQYKLYVLKNFHAHITNHIIVMLIN